ncbi:COMM domain-containing protein 7 [Alexandromys fortis]|uniref:COMM domain-containing protein 7 n=1 Tax=Alexandromys fortis TaxID=100897 RepID=UPI0021538FF5|nr:COMM domain-containing protein 7 [Microtus fortis]
MGRLHCMQDPVPEAVRGDMQQLNQLGAQVERFLAQLSEFATTNQISLGPLKSIMKSLLLVPNGALKKGLTAEQVQADLLTLGLSEEKATYFSEKWKQNASTLAQWAIGQTLMINQLIDMEWRFGVTSGSSELEKVGSIFLQVSLWAVATGRISFFYIYIYFLLFIYFMCTGVKVSDPLELDLQRVVSCHVGAGN